jgi:protein dithiol oxidoreductase (disulfide-forming)
MSIRNCARTLALCALAAATLATGATPAALEEGKDFRTLTPARPTASPGKIEVVEFFSYACPHCAHFFPLVNAWEGKLPKDVAFRRVPVGFGRPEWVNLQRAYYALLAGGDFARLDGALFYAIHEEQQPLMYEPTIAEWIGKNGGNAAQFATAYTSFGVNNQTVQADRMAEDYAIDSIPAMAIDGKYVAMADPARGELGYLQQLLENTDKLIARVRAEHAAASPAASTPAAKHK